MKKRILISCLLLVLVSMACLSTGCGSASDSGKSDQEIKKEAAKTSAPEPDKKPEADPDSAAEKSDDDKDADDTALSGQSEDKDPLQDASESEAEATYDVDEWWPKYDSPEDVLDDYLKTHDGALPDGLGYLMYDVNADGYEELIITVQDRIEEIYGNYKGKLHQAFSTYADYEVTLYPEGMLKMTSPDTSEDTETCWQQYFPDLGDYLRVFEEANGEYYTFCAYDLTKNDMDEINQSLESTGDYPVWIGEWLDMISKKEYDSLVPKTKPVKLLKADAFSDRSALEVKPETLLFVEASDGYANLRTGPGTEYEIICQIPNGGEMEMYLKNATSESGKKWLKVTYYTDADNEDGYTWLTGWIAESQLE